MAPGWYANVVAAGSALRETVGVRLFFAAWIASSVIACTAVLPDAGQGTDKPRPVPGLAVFDTTRLHRVHIEVAQSDLAALDADRENRVSCRISFDDVTLENAGVRLKIGLGSNSSLADKPGFSLKFNEFVSGQKLDGLSRLLLNNAQQDESFVNEHLGYEAHRLAGGAAPRTAHAWVTLNETSYGLMVVKEPIAKDFLETTFGDGNGKGNTYEGAIRLGEFELGDFVHHPEALDLKDEVEDGRTREDVIALAALIRDEPAATFAAGLRNHLAVDAYLTVAAVDTLVGHWDSYHYFLNNYYLYRNPGDGLFHFLPHGMDQLSFAPVDRPAEGTLFERVGADATLRGQFDAELARVRGDVALWAGLQERMDGVQRMLQAATLDDERLNGDVARFEAAFASKRAAVGAAGGL